ncbi:MAG TPA: DUF6580 family putative transport protein [Bryobacteraceae bacterium]|nr:DUF6580 family putative transport protein [Bryobacteraceae bacterium]
MTKNSNWRPVALSLTTLGAIARLIPHPPNFAPVGAVSLFAGARLPVWQAYLVPLALMAITDPILAAFYHVPAYSRYQIFIYLSFVIGVWLGRRLRATENIAKIAAFSVLNSVQFFLLTNFGSWLWFQAYPRTSAGLADCYLAAIPFFAWTFVSDLLFTGVLFGLHAWLSRTVASEERVAVTV